MTTMQHPSVSAPSRPAERITTGLVLLAIGTVVALGFLVDGLDRFTLLGVSAVTLVAFAVTREYGFAVAAGITGGLGTAVAIISGGAIEPIATGGTFFLSFATGWVAVYLLGLGARPRETNPWPLVPAAIMGSIGTVLALGRPDLLWWVQATIATLLIAGGVAIAIRARRHA